MSIAKKADEQAMDEDFLSDDHAGDFLNEGFHPHAVFLDMLGKLGCVDTHECSLVNFETGWLEIRSISGESTDHLRLWIVVDEGTGIKLAHAGKLI
jgi:hypothetical protein